MEGTAMDRTDEYGVSHQWQQQINSMITDANARIDAAEARLGALEADLARELGALRRRLDRSGARLDTLEERLVGRARGAEDRLADLEQWAARLEARIEGAP
jgi:hypothetical protein